ncbi:MAG: group II truncated hemoglobin [Acidimicrobiia bacterium]|jgi:hemoglobin
MMGYSRAMMPGRPPETEHPWGDAATPYLEVGGDERVKALAETFYDVIEEQSPRLQALLPANTANTRRKLHMYLSGWMGGPPLYEEKWGHPRLRMRHMPFPIGKAEAVEWMRCMRAAMDRVEVHEPLRTFLDERFEPLADHMRNQPDN